MEKATAIKPAPQAPRGSSVVDAPTAALMELFRSELADVRFPDVDAATLEDAVRDVDAAAAEVEGARRALETASENLRGQQRDLREKARLAYRYARVFATGDEQLSAALAGISFEEATAKPKKRRGRKPKKSAAPQLALASEPAETGADHEPAAPAS